MQRRSRCNVEQDATKINFIFWHVVISNFSVDGRISKTPLNVRGVLIEEAGIMEIGAVDGRFFPMRPKLSGNGRSCRTHLGTSL